MAKLTLPVRESDQRRHVREVDEAVKDFLDVIKLREAEGAYVFMIPMDIAVLVAERLKEQPER